MASQMWKRTLHFLGLVEDYEDEYQDLPDEPAVPRMPDQPAAPRPEPSNVRRIPSAGQPEPSPSMGSGGVAVHSPSGSSQGGAPQGYGAGVQTNRPVTAPSVHMTNPTTFNDVEEVGERFRNGVPVIMNLQGASEAVAKRLLDFASGLIYGLDGRIERAGDRVFLLTPAGVDVSTEERARLSERGFFNQD